MVFSVIIFFLIHPLPVILSMPKDGFGKNNSFYLSPSPKGAPIFRGGGAVKYMVSTVKYKPRW